MKIKLINCKIVDGTGNNTYVGDILIENERIVKIGDCGDMEADHIINADGYYAAPGFIDVHTHSDLSVLYDGSAENRIYDGVTTDVCGNCGVGPAPVSKKYKDELMSYLKTRMVGNIDADLDFHWESYEEYLNYMEAKDIAVNMVPILAEGAVRISTMGLEQREATQEELETMKREVRKAMEAGAVGMSSGLIYLPGAYVPKEEMIELCKVVAEYDGFYTTHVRDEGDKEEEAFKEAFQVAKASGARLNISHLKLLGKRNHNKTGKIFKLIAEAKDSGLCVTCDQHPYNTAMTSLLAMLPPWASNGGMKNLLNIIQMPKEQEKMMHDINNGILGWQNVLKAIGGFKHLIISTIVKEENKWMEGKRMSDIARKLNISNEELFFKLLLEDEARTLVIVEGLSQEDVEIIASRPEIMIGSDSATLSKNGPLSKGKPHPRGYGSYAHFLKNFVREKKIISLETAIRKMTALAAEHLHIKDRGYLKEGYFADIVVFNLDKIKDNATITNPREYSSGFEYVLVNGKLALENGIQTSERAGKVLRRDNSKFIS